MYRSIMVPLDGSTFGEHALPLALTIARSFGATVRLVHVHVPPTYIYSVDVPALYDDMLNTSRRASEQNYLEDMALRLSQSWEVPVDAVLLDGTAADALHTYAEEHEVDLVVMTTHGRGAVSRFWLGSVADKLMRQVDLPVILVRPHVETLDLIDLTQVRPLRNILIPLDGSKMAESVLEPTIALGAKMGAKYTLLQAIDPLRIDYVPAMYVSGLNEAILEEWKSAAKASLEQVAGRLREQGLDVQTHIIFAQPATAILEYMHQHVTDLVAMATHGRSGVQRMVLGSVADKVVRGASVPVLLYRQPVQGAPHPTDVEADEAMLAPSMDR